MSSEAVVLLLWPSWEAMGYDLVVTCVAALNPQP